MAYPSNEPDDQPAGEQLLDLVERIEAVEEDMRKLRADRSEVYAEAKALGFDTRVMKKIIALRKRDATDVAEEEALMETYKRALGME